MQWFLFFLQQSYAIVPSAGEGQVRLFNPLNCVVHLNPSIDNVSRLEPLSAAEFLHLPVDETKQIITTISADQPCISNSLEIQVTIHEKKVGV